MRFGNRTRQRIFRDDKMSSSAFDTRQCLKRIGPGAIGAPIDFTEIRGGRAESLGIIGRRLGKRLWKCWLAVIGIRSHPGHDLDEFVCGMRGFQRPIQCVAIETIDQHRLFFSGPWHAHDPFGIRQLGFKVLGFNQVEIGLGDLSVWNVDGSGSSQVVARGSYDERIMAGSEPVCGKSVASLFVTAYGQCDRRTVFFLRLPRRPPSGLLRLR